jgi:hypothetical protein
VYRANWKSLEKQLALKSFFNLDNITVKEIVREVIKYTINFFFLFYLLVHYIYFKNLNLFILVEIQREVDFHDNIIRCHGITKFESGIIKILKLLLISLIKSIFNIFFFIFRKP